MAGYLRFRRTARIAPGIRLNLSKSGISTSFGPRGFHYTVGHGRHRTTVGIPGTGLSYTTYSSAHAAARRSRPSPPAELPAAPRAPATSASAPPASVQSTASFTRLAGLLPSQKIAWGIVLTLLVITSPVGLWLLATGLWELRVPEWRIRMYVHQAALEPANAEELLGQAMAIDPQSPEALGPLAELRSAHGDDAAALPLYREYCRRVPSDWLARGHYAMTAMRCNQVDEAITQLDDIRQHAPVAEDSLASVIAHLAFAHLCKEDPRQALALIDHANTHPAAAAPGAQQCLFYQAVCEYMLGRTAVAIAQLDRLYAINPDYEGLRAVKDGMSAGTYELVLPGGDVLAPVSPGRLKAPAIEVRRTAPRSAHCTECQAPLPSGATECAYCHAAAATPATAIATAPTATATTAATVPPWDASPPAPAVPPPPPPAGTSAGWPPPPPRP